MDNYQCVSINSIPGIKIGNAQNFDAITGCTVILCEKGGTGGVDQRGGAPGTRETDAIRPMHLVNEIHGIYLAGGSAYGLDGAGGVMKYLEEKGAGIDVGVARVPVVPGAILFDLPIGDPKIRPDAQMAYQACQAASDTNLELGSVGAGTGATAGKILGMKFATKSGLGAACLEIGRDIFVGAVIAANPFGEIYNYQTGQIIAGVRGDGIIFKNDPGTSFISTLDIMKSVSGKAVMSFSNAQNTVIGAVLTNARLNREEANKVAQIAHNGIALSVRPAHTMFDGDTLFCLSTNKKKVDPNIVGAFASIVVAKAIVQAAILAAPLGNMPSYQSLSK